MNRIHFDEDLIALEEFIRSGSDRYSNILVLTDEHTSLHCWPVLVAAVPELGKAELIEIPAGEASKCIEVAVQLWEAMRELRADRSSLLLNLGGGMVTDLGGFVASTYMRGIDFVHIPTSLLAQVDAAVGGKTGIDLGHYKNLVGTFTEATATFIHSGFLQTLPPRQIMAGFAEMLKHGLLEGGAHWEHVRSIQHPAAADLTDAIRYSVELKKRIVSEDASEKGKRKLLNFGHSFGHALESLALDEHIDLLHGEAVALGMQVELVLSAHKGLMTHHEARDLCRILSAHFPENPLELETYEGIEPYLISDKKNFNGEVRVVLLEAPGKAVHDIPVSPEELEEAWETFRSGISV